jgi:hypothetical protein
MKEALDNARQELKRVDHLFFVSLKYTRTVDMMRHMIERLINALSFTIDSLLKYAKEEKKISQVPDNPTIKCDVLLKALPDEGLADFINLYLSLRKIIRADYTKREEYRRHVTMTSVLDDGKVIEINIDVLKTYYDAAKDFANYSHRKINGEEEL